MKVLFVLFFEVREVREYGGRGSWNVIRRDVRFEFFMFLFLFRYLLLSLGRKVYIVLFEIERDMGRVFIERFVIDFLFFY